MSDSLYSAPAERNKDPILRVLRQHLPPSGSVLEVASGTGQHVTHFAQAFPRIVWQPTDPDEASRRSILARSSEIGLANVLPPLDLNVCCDWPDAQFAAVITANLLHISPVEVLPALCAGAARVLDTGGVLHIYGPFKRRNVTLAQGNANFDRSLRARDPRWGIRDFEVVCAMAEDSGFTLREVVEMPANNLSLVFAR